MLKVMLVVGGLVVVVGCSSGGGSEESRSDDPLDGDGRDAYVAAFEGDEGEVVTEEVAEERACVAEAVVDGVGVEELRDVATPREIAAASAGGGVGLEGVGVEVGVEQADAIFAGVRECGDLGESFVREMVPGGGGELPAAVECFKSKLDDDVLREIVMTRIVEGDAAFADKPEITARLMEIGRSCAVGT